MNQAGKVFTGITRTFEHYKGKIQRVNQIRRERDQAMQAQLDADIHSKKERDPSYIAMDKPKPFPAPSVMGMGRRIVK